ncbi:MAG: Zn-ribbon domain-containing OB-fold protein [Myxococcota bacterium]
MSAPAKRHPRPALDWETRAFWEGCGRHELVLQRCRRCQAVQHRPRALCVSCLSDEIEHFIASGRGQVYSFTITRQNQAPPFRDSLPYVLAYVELEEGVRLLTNIVGCEPGDVTIGMPVVADYLDLGGDLALPRFLPA